MFTMKGGMMIRFGVTCLMGFVSLLMISCEDVDEVNRLKESIKMKEETLADVESRMAKEEEALRKNEHLSSVEERYKEAQKKLETLNATLEAEKGRTSEAAAAVKAASLKLINYRNQYRRVVRGRAKGTTIDLSASKGADYKDVRIARITPLELRVFLSSGPKGIPFNELPADVQERFQFSEEEANSFRKAVKKLAIVQAKENKAPDADQQIKQATLDATKVAAEIAEKKSAIASLTRRIKEKELEAEHLESLARQWRSEQDNSRGKASASTAGARAVKLSDQANDVRLKIAKAEEMVLQLRNDIGQLLK